MSGICTIYIYIHFIDESWNIDFNPTSRYSKIEVKNILGHGFT